MHAQRPVSRFLCSRDHWNSCVDGNHGSLDNGWHWRRWYCDPSDQRVYGLPTKASYLALTVFDLCMLSDTIYLKLLSEASREESICISRLWLGYHHDADSHLRFLHWCHPLSDPSRYRYLDDFGTPPLFPLLPGCPQGKPDYQERE